MRRWGKIEKDFCTKNKTFDISKIPDIYDCIKYDLQHNQHSLQFEQAEELYINAKYLADIVIPQVFTSQLFQTLVDYTVVFRCIINVFYNQTYLENRALLQIKGPLTGFPSALYESSRLFRGWGRSTSRVKVTPLTPPPA